MQRGKEKPLRYTKYETNCIKKGELEEGETMPLFHEDVFEEPWWRKYAPPWQLQIALSVTAVTISIIALLTQ